MNQYISGKLLKKLREDKGLTQLELSEIISVSDKTISKWETGRGLPDISFLEPISKALDTSVVELLSGEQIVNRNISGNMLKSIYYVCPICGNFIHSMGEVVVSCHGINLPKLEADENKIEGYEVLENKFMENNNGKNSNRDSEEIENINTEINSIVNDSKINVSILNNSIIKNNIEHFIIIEKVENEHYITLNHQMTKEHYISFLAYVTSDKIQVNKLYPEGNAEARFLIRGHGRIYGYCNKHGLFYKKI